MKKLTIVLANLLILGLSSCEKAAEFQLENASYTSSFTFGTKSMVPIANSKNLDVVVEGKGSYSFSGEGTFVDRLVLGTDTGAATHTMEFTDAKGDKIYSTLSTQIGATSITGTGKFTGGTGRYSKISGDCTNAGSLIDAQGNGSWKETGKVTF